MRLIRWIFSLSILAVWCALVGTVLFAAMYEDPAEIGPAEAIVVLGGNAPGPKGLTGESAERLARGLALFDQGVAPLLVVTGGGETPVAPVMAATAIEAGVPEASILVETRATSTLQNALFTADFEQLDPSTPIVIVTHRYHLPRAWASFRWAGFSDVTGVAADPEAKLEMNQPMAMESVKWPLNLLRAGAASVAMAWDVPREKFLKYLQ